MRHILLAKASQINEIKQAKDTPAQVNVFTENNRLEETVPEWGRRNLVVRPRL